LYTTKRHTYPHIQACISALTLSAHLATSTAATLCPIAIAEVDLVPSLSQNSPFKALLKGAQRAFAFYKPQQLRA